MQRFHALSLWNPSVSPSQHLRCVHQPESSAELWRPEFFPELNYFGMIDWVTGHSISGCSLIPRGPVAESPYPLVGIMLDLSGDQSATCSCLRSAMNHLISIAKTTPITQEIPTVFEALCYKPGAKTKFILYDTTEPKNLSLYVFMPLRKPLMEVRKWSTFCNTDSVMVHCGFLHTHTSMLI